MANNNKHRDIYLCTEETCAIKVFLYGVTEHTSQSRKFHVYVSVLVERFSDVFAS